MALNSLKSKLKYRISRNAGVVFVPADFRDLSDRDQVGRALRELVREEVLIKFGRGLYAKARRSSLSNSWVLKWSRLKSRRAITAGALRRCPLGG